MEAQACVRTSVKMCVRDDKCVRMKTCENTCENKCGQVSKNKCECENKCEREQACGKDKMGV